MKNRSAELEVAALAGILDGLRRIRRTATFAFVTEHLNYKPGSQKLWDLLQTVILDDVSEEVHQTALLVVMADTARPPRRTWDMIRHAGCDVPDDPAAEERYFMLQMQAMGVNPALPMRPEY